MHGKVCSSWWVVTIHIIQLFSEMKRFSDSRVYNRKFSALYWHIWCLKLWCAAGYIKLCPLKQADKSFWEGAGEGQVRTDQVGSLFTCFMGSQKLCLQSAFVFKKFKKMLPSSVVLFLTLIIMAWREVMRCSGCNSTWLCISQFLYLSMAAETSTSAQQGRWIQVVWGLFPWKFLKWGQWDTGAGVLSVTVGALLCFEHPFPRRCS